MTATGEATTNTVDILGDVGRALGSPTELEPDAGKGRELVLACTQVVGAPTGFCNLKVETDETPDFPTIYKPSRLDLRAASLRLV